MKFQRSTLVLLVVALLLGGLVLVTSLTGNAPKGDMSAQIFSFKEADVQSFTITTGEQTLAIRKAPDPQAAPTQAAPSDSPAPSPRWQIQQPQGKPPVEPPVEPAEDATVAYLLSVLTTGQYDRILTMPTDELANLGLKPPAAIVSLTLTNQTSHRLLLGAPDFSNRFLYAQIDPPQPSENSANSTVAVALVPIDLQNAILRPLSDWQQSSKPKANPVPPETNAPSTQPNPEVPLPSAQPSAPAAPSGN